MKFSSNRYYVEKYEKCSVCGKLVFEEKIEKVNAAGQKALYCSDWCVNWEIKKQNKQTAEVMIPER
jgi:N-methylhydantoinase B